MKDTTLITIRVKKDTKKLIEDIQEHMNARDRVVYSADTIVNIALKKEKKFLGIKK